MRALPHWIRAYVEYTSGQEAPEPYHYWTAMSVISTALRKQIWKDRGIYLLYPNLYVIVVGPSGDKKSTALRCGKKLLDTLNPTVKIFNGKITGPEVVIKRMSKNQIDGKSCLLLFASELSNMINVEVIKRTFAQFISEVYDADDKFEYIRMGGDDYTIVEPYVTILGASTANWIEEAIPTKQVGGGFTSRIIFVQDKLSKRRLVPFPERAITQENIALRKKLITDLAQIASLKGVYSWGKGAEDWFDPFYAATAVESEKRSAEDGYYARKADLVIKLAMIIGCAKRDALTIEVEDLQEAKQEIEKQEKSRAELLTGLSATEEGANILYVREIIAQHSHDTENGMSHSDLVRDVQSRMNASTLRPIIFSLKEGNIIEEKVTGEGRPGPVGRYYRSILQ